MSISTGRGDDGTTQLMHGPRVSKAHPRVACCGAVDELGAHLGLARSFCGGDPLAERLETIQRELFLVGAVLSTPPTARDKLRVRLTGAEVARLEAEEATIEAIDGLLSDWALPGATQVGAVLDVARTVCRRAEREVVALVDAGEETDTAVTGYLNRLSDLLWLYARWYEVRQGAEGALHPDRDRRWSQPGTS